MIPQHHYVSCAGCGIRVHAYDIASFSCPNRDVLPEFNHVLQKKHVITQQFWLRAHVETSPNPFIRYRHRLLSYHRALNAQLSDKDYCAKVETLDRALIESSGTGFSETPVRDEKLLARKIGMNANQRLYVKDETRNVAGSHKARHLFGILLNLDDETSKRDFAIASCGNAALAAATICKAAEKNLDVFIPPDAEDAVVGQLKALGAKLHVSVRREGQTGDPCYAEFRKAVEEGALPFTCQGPDNGLTIEGGQCLGYELFDYLRKERVNVDHAVIQVGGGALASSFAQALAENMKFESLAVMPRLHTVQTRGAFPLARAYDRIVAMIMSGLHAESWPNFESCVDDMSFEKRARLHDVDALRDRLADADCIRSAWDATAVQAVMRYAAVRKSVFMWPWEEAPHSVAHGILDDETYDWYTIVHTMLRTGGVPVVVDEDKLRRAHDAAHEATEVRPSHTGSAGLAGLMSLKEAGIIHDSENAAILFTGIERQF